MVWPPFVPRLSLKPKRKAASPPTSGNLISGEGGSTGNAEKGRKAPAWGMVRRSRGMCIGTKLSSTGIRTPTGFPFSKIYPVF